MNNKIDYINLMRDSGLSLIGVVAGLSVIVESITLKVAIKYATFAIICGPVTRSILNQYPTELDYQHAIIILVGLFGFFIFKGLMIVALKFSRNPLKTISDIKDIKKVKK